MSLGYFERERDENAAEIGIYWLVYWFVYILIQEILYNEKIQEITIISDNITMK